MIANLLIPTLLMTLEWLDHYTKCCLPAAASGFLMEASMLRVESDNLLVPSNPRTLKGRAAEMLDGSSCSWHLTQLAEGAKSFQQGQ